MLSINAQTHPCLTLTKKGLKEIKANLGKTPLYDTSFEVVKKAVDKAIAKGIDVPIPKELAGGYSHEVHRNNYTTMANAGLLFQITGDARYAKYLKEILHKYADLYPHWVCIPPKTLIQEANCFGNASMMPIGS